MSLLEGYEPFVDARGEIRDLLRDTKLDSVTHIHTVAGAVRGNHFHARTTQWIYIVSGLLHVVTRRDAEEPQAVTLKAGDLWIDEPNVRHAWYALEDTDVLVFTEGPRSGDRYETDVVRLPESERLI